MKRLFILQLLLLLCLLPAYGQQKGETFTMEGVVLDPSLNDDPLVGVNVYLKDRPGVGTTTDINGRFSLKVSKGDIMIFSYMGYDNLEHPVGKENRNMKMLLVPSANQLEETVVVGTGVTRKASVVGAITSVNVSELQKPATNVVNMLAGRVPGVIAVQASGEPGKNISEFWIRGIGTFGANQSALVLIDGLEGRLSDVDPADIESFSVLKDASATAIYGVRGANGVVIVTTKRGVKDKLRITARASLKVSQLKRLPEYLDAYDYATLANEARAVSSMPQLYSDMELKMIEEQMDPDLYPNVNWQDELLNQTSLQQTYYVSARGGGSIARYFVSLNMSNEGAAYKQEPTSKYNSNVGYNTYGYRANLDLDLTKSTVLYFGVDGFISNRNEPGMANTDKIWDTQAKLTPLTIPKMYSNGLFPAYDGGMYSPYVMLNYTGTKKSAEYKNMTTLRLSQDLSMVVKGLKVYIQGAYNTQANTDETRYLRPELWNATERNVDGELKLLKKADRQTVSYSQGRDFLRKYYMEAQANYQVIINEMHRIDAVLKYSMGDYKKESDASNNTLKAISRRNQEVAAKVAYGFKDTYLLDVNFGYTGSENFQPGRQFGFFPSVALGWVPTQYDWVREKLPWLTSLKIRGSYGTAGNDRISGDKRFPYLTLINDNAGTGWGAGLQGITEDQLGADNLQWEVAVKTNVGMDLTLLDNKINLTVDYFNDKRNDIFQQRTNIPDYIGLATSFPYGNVGSMRSYGSDGNISYTENIGKDWSFTVRGNFTFSTNEVLSWEENNLPYDYLYRRNWPNDIQRGFISLGLFKDEADVLDSPNQFGKVRPGDIKYKDVNGDGVINNDDQVPLAFRNYPRLQYGFGGEVKYKDFTLGVMLRGTGRVDVFHTDKHYENVGWNHEGWIPFHNGKTGNVLAIANNQANRWTPAWYSGDPSTENPNAKFPRLTYGYNDNNSKNSTFWHDDARYLRLQEVSLQYTLKAPNAIKRLGVSSVDFQLVGNNLAVWDKIKLFDPEQAEKNGRVYPIPTTYALQVYVNF